MRINSDRSYKFLGLVYLLCLFAVLFDVLVINIEGSLGSLSKVTPIAVVITIFLIYRGLPVFQYDSDGEVLNFTGKEPNLQWLGKLFVSHFEFPKRKLSAYKVKKYPLRRKLVVYINSKDGHRKKQSVTISYLSKREVRDLTRSLNGVIAKNKGQKTDGGAA